MSDLAFTRKHALKAIHLVESNGIDWLYTEYPKPNGRIRRSRTGFLMYEGEEYPVKPLGRLANKLAGMPMKDNPQTYVFRRHFEHLGFQLVESAEDEAREAAERQRKLAAVWVRPGQAAFRRRVFALFGARCLVSKCDTLAALEAAHIVPFRHAGVDEGWNGLPLRADLHRLFDCGMITLDAKTLRLKVAKSARHEYGAYHNVDLSDQILNTGQSKKIAEALRTREELESD